MQQLSPASHGAVCLDAYQVSAKQVPVSGPGGESDLKTKFSVNADDIRYLGKERKN